MRTLFITVIIRHKICSSVFHKAIAVDKLIMLSNSSLASIFWRSIEITLQNHKFISNVAVLMMPERLPKQSVREQMANCNTSATSKPKSTCSDADSNRMKETAKRTGNWLMNWRPNSRPLERLVMSRFMAGIEKTKLLALRYSKIAQNELKNYSTEK